MRIEAADIWRDFTPFLSGDTFGGTSNAIRLLLKLAQGDAGNVLLKEVAEDVKRSLNAFLQDGVNHLSNAEQTSRPEKRQEYLEKAAAAFLQASSRADCPLDARSMEYAAICYHHLGDKNLEKDWFAKAYERSEGNHRQVRSDVDFHESLSGKALWRVKLLAQPFTHPNADPVNEAYVGGLITLFEIEAQMRHLQSVNASFGTVLTLPPMYYPASVVQVSQWVTGRRRRKTSDVAYGFSGYDKDGRAVLKFILFKTPFYHP